MTDDILYIICMFASAVVEAFLAMDYLGYYHEYRYPFDKRAIRAIVGIIIGIIVSVINSFNSSVMNMICSLILYLMVALLVYRGEIAHRIIHWMICIMVAMSCELVVAGVFTVPVSARTNEIYKNELMLISLVFVSKLLQFLALGVVKQVSLKAEGKPGLRLFLSFSIVPISTIGLMTQLPYVFLNDDISNTRRIVLLTFYVILVVGNIFVYNAFSSYTRNREEKYIGEIYEARYSSRMHRQRRLSQMDERYRTDMHNIKYSLRQIGVYKDNKEYDKIDDVLKNLDIDIRNSETREITGDRFLNLFLTDFVDRAEAASVDIKVFVEPGFKYGSVSEADMSVILGNLIDNAIEAAEKIEDGRVEVSLYMENSGCICVCRIRNTYNGEIKERRGKLITTKKDRDLHGLGVSSVMDLVDKNGGYMQTEHDDRVYRTTVLFPVDVKV